MPRNTLFAASLFALAAAPIAGAAIAQEAPTDAIANLSAQGREAFTVYSQFSDPKAFAVSPDGAYGFYGGEGSLDRAMSEALRRCAAVTTIAGGCEVVSMNDEPMIAAGPGVAEALRGLDTTTMGGLREAAVADFRRAPAPKALALAEDGAWGWVAGASSTAEARTEALNHCANWGSGCSVSEVE